MKIPSKKIISAFLKVVVSLLALFWVFRQIELQSVLSVLATARVHYLVLAFAAFVLSKWIAARRLNFFFRSIEVLINEWQNIRLYLLGMFYNLFLPGGIGGDGYKIFILNRKTGIKSSKIFWAVLIDRLNGVLALFCLSVLLAYFIHPDIDFSYRAWLWFLVPSGIATFMVVIKKLAGYFNSVLVITTILSFLVQGLQLLSAMFIYFALGGEEGLMDTLFIFLISSIVAMFPVSIGGVGLRELTFLYGSEFLGLDESISVAISLMFYIITAFTSFWGVYYSIRSTRIFS